MNAQSEGPLRYVLQLLLVGYREAQLRISVRILLLLTKYSFFLLLVPPV